MTRKNYSMKAHDRLSAYAMLFPTFILITVFAIVPILITLQQSFTNSSFYQEVQFVGFDNYRNVLSDPAFFRSVIVGLKFVAFVVPVQLILSFLFAHVIRGMPRRLSGFVKTSVYVPVVISGVIASVIFVFFYDYQAGLLNQLAGMAGMERQAWLNDPKTALASIAAPAIWLGFGYTTLFMLAGLLDIPESYYESATIDGANAVQRMIYITIPSVKNILLFLLVAGFIGALQEFNLPYMMTGGGPVGETMTPVLFLYFHFTRDLTVGYSLAGSLVMALVIGLISALMFKVFTSQKGMDA